MSEIDAAMNTEGEQFFSAPGTQHPGSPPSWPAQSPPFVAATPHRRWPIAVASALVSAVLAATIAVIATRTAIQPQMIAPQQISTTAAAAPAPTTPPPPVPLPTAVADRRTCQAWLAAGTHIETAKSALASLPNGVTVVDPGIHDHQQWAEAVRTSSAEFDRAADTLTEGIAPGTTPALQKAALTAAAALHGLAIANLTADPANGNSFHTWHEAADTVNVMCERLAPQ